LSTIEHTALTNLIHNEPFARKVLPFLKGDYFSDRTDRIVFEEIQKFVEKYNALPNHTSIEVEMSSRKDLNEEDYKRVLSVIQSLQKEDDDVNFEWLVETTEQFCKDKAVYNAIVAGIKIIEGKDNERGVDSLPSILTDALAVGFDNRVGHDYLVDADSRFEFYHKVEEKIPFDLDFFNRITKGGLPTKTLNIALAGTGVGKSLFMCHMAANCLSQNRSVLYITLEMAEERIAERIDANLMNISIDDLHDLPKTMYDTKMDKIIKNTKGNLVIKEYPTASAHSSHFRGLIKELAIKKSFKPDIIFIDYLNICASSRFKANGNVNSYMYIKAIAEELRGLAVETNVPIMSATQTTRSGFSNSDIGLEDTSESFGLPATADLMFALISNEELDAVNQIAVKQLKNRYNDPTINKRFVVGIDRAKMKLFDVSDAEQKGLADSNQKEDASFSDPVFDKTEFGEGWKV
jgi:replicative DNA helicase